jgi:predicted TIM-barrel fold metal-dependent hydrolase
LFPYLDEHWRDSITNRGIHELDTIAYPANSPLTARPDWRPEKGKPASTLDLMRSQALDPFGLRYAICNCLYGIQVLNSEDMAATFASAINDWIAREWLDKEPRLRASIIVPMQNPDLAAQEIERCAADKRFVQVIMLVMDEIPLGRRHYWPIYEAAERNGLAVGIHAGSSYRHPVTGVGWPSYYTEDYAAQAQGFQSTLTSLICEGVFAKFPSLKVVLLESGFTWLPAHLWRLTKFWHGLRTEVPWVDRSPTEIVRSNVRFSLQPVDGPPDPTQMQRLIDHLHSDDLLLFSTDYPHWQFDGQDALPDGLSSALTRKIMVDNPLATYPRLTETVQ